MAPSCDMAASILLCAEDNSSILCLEEDDDEVVVVVEELGLLHQDLAVDIPLQSEQCVAGLVERETEHMPREDYAERMRRGGLDLCIRRGAIDWIWKVYTYYNFSPLTGHLAINYLDRFLSQYELPESKAWMTHLLSVACLSLAAKMEETAVPLPLDLQVGDTRYVFEAKPIQRMELLVLGTLKWRMQAVTPFSYIDYFLHKLNGSNAPPRRTLWQSTELILLIAKGTGCLGFRPSEIAAAVAAAVVGEADISDIGKDCPFLDKERVLQCHEMVQAMALMSTVPPKPASDSRGSSVPQSPIGVLDAGCLSYKSDDDTTIASHASCCYDGILATSKRRKINR